MLLQEAALSELSIQGDNIPETGREERRTCGIDYNGILIK